MASTVETITTPEVYEVDEEFPADVAGEASGVPHSAGPAPRCHHHDITSAHTLTTLQTQKEAHTFSPGEVSRAKVGTRVGSCNRRN